MGRETKTPSNHRDWSHALSQACGEKVQEWIPDWDAQGREGTFECAGELVGGCLCFDSFVCLSEGKEGGWICQELEGGMWIGEMPESKISHFLGSWSEDI